MPARIQEIPCRHLKPQQTLNKYNKILENTLKNQLFGRSVLGLNNATFEHRDEETAANRVIFAGNFLLLLGAAEYISFFDQTATEK